MKRIRSFFARILPALAVSGILMAGWGYIVLPDTATTPEWHPGGSKEKGWWWATRSDSMSSSRIARLE